MNIRIFFCYLEVFVISFHMNLYTAMLLMVGISSQIGILLGFLLPIHDSFLKDRITQSKFTGLTCMAMAAIGIIFCLRCGLNWVDIFDGYSGTLPLLCIGMDFKIF